MYNGIKPDLRLRLPFEPIAVREDWFDWPALPELFPKSFPGVQTKRDSFLIDTDLDRLKERVSDYFDPTLNHDEIARRYPDAMKSSSGFVVRDARSVRDALLARGGPDETGFVRHAYRPFDGRWLYWEAGHGLLGRPVPDYRPHVFEGNIWLSAAQHLRKGETEPQTCLAQHLGSLHMIERTALWFPAWLRDDDMGSGGDGLRRRPNLAPAAQRYLRQINASVEDLFHHVLAVLHDPAYREANAGALRMEWPRIPLPGWPDGDTSEAAETLAHSAARSRELAALINPDTPVPGVTTGTLRSDIATIAVPATVDGRNIAGDDFALTAGWGHYGTGDAVMPGQGRVVEREYTADERAALVGATGRSPLHGHTTFDIYLNGNAYWRNVPAAVWRYKLGGYQVLKKWLSYRERPVLGRALLPEEVLYFAEVARRIAAIVATTDNRVGRLSEA